MREHGQRHVEVVVRMRAPGQAPVAAGLRHAHRAGHGPEVRVGQRDVDRLQRQRMAPAGASRWRPCWWPSAGRWRGGTRPSPRGPRSRPRRRTGLRHRRRTPRMSRIRRIASFSSQPPFGSSVTRASGKRSCSARDGLDLVLAAQHAALELEVVEAVALVRRLGQAHDGLGRHAPPRGAGATSRRRRPGRCAYGRSVLRAVADVEQVAEHLDRVALLAFAEQRRDRHVEVLAEQVEQRRLDRRDGVDGDAQVEGLQAAAAASRSANGCCASLQQALVRRRSAGRRPAGARLRASGGSSRRPALRRRRCGRRCR